MKAGVKQMRMFCRMDAGHQNEERMLYVPREFPADERPELTAFEITYPAKGSHFDPDCQLAGRQAQGRLQDGAQGRC